MSSHVTSADDELRGLLRSSVERFGQDNGDRRKLRNARGVGSGVPTLLWGEMAARGWFGLLVPESHGGSGLGFGELAIVAQGLGSALLAEPFVSTAVGGPLVLLRCGNDTLQRELLPAVASGEERLALAWQENATLDISSLRTACVDQGSRLTLSGRKRFVAAGLDATRFVVAAVRDGALGLYLTDTAHPSIHKEAELRADGTSSCTLMFRDTPAMELAGPALARQLLEEAVDATVVMSCAELVGLIDGALQVMLQYLRDRRQFGRALGGFQALQHRAVDLYIQQQLSIAALGAAVRELDGDSARAERGRAASRAKSRCANAALRVTRQAIQLHGAMGITDECDIGLYLKRALVASAWMGNAAAHRQRFASFESASTE